MQAEPMTALLGREPVVEDPGHVLGRDPHSGIHHRDFNARGTPGNAYRDASQRVARNFARVLGVAYEIHEYLQDLVDELNAIP